ncbi:MAG: S-layer homology domain-containing protein [Candidatus Peribacteraceae bacterium]|nr:S-layer homology domain-containing protein [Candidatus Peribacteraceae bacterium]
MRLRISVIAALLFLIAPSAGAVKFPDVPATYAHSRAVERLSDMSVIGGNPDGTFRPHDPVNRAAILKMLYQAAKKSPERVGGCFSDVEQGSWYELYVCDAAVNGYVQGYTGADGKKSFKPAQPVTRAEAIKMTLVIMGIPEANLNMDVGMMYGDVASTDWHARFVHTALANKILPISGQEGPNLKPGQILERGEAAAYIWNAVEATRTLPASSSSASGEPTKSEEAASSAASEIEKRAAAALRTIAQEDAALKRIEASTKNVAMPFSDKGTFDGKTPYSYVFRVSDITTVEILGTINDWTMGGMNCRLYLLGRSGFSQEYYLGFEDGKNCTIRAALSPGNWRLELTPKMLAPPFIVTAKIIKGDGNDGFAQAAVLPLGQVRTEELGENDLEDWFTFTVPRDAKTAEIGGREMTLSVASTLRPGCIIYPLADVDVYGFRSPDCEHKYVYPPGTYMVAIRHAQPFTIRQSYTLQIK